MRDIHEGVDLETSTAYRERCLADYWDAVDRVALASLAIAAINNHIQLLHAQMGIT